MKTSTKFKAGCGILAVFGAGFLLGAISLLILIGNIIPLSEGWKSEKSKKFIANHFQKQLKLTPEQDAEFRPLVYEVLDRRWDFRKDYILGSRQMMEEEFFPRAAEILDEEQEKKALKMLANWKKNQHLKVDDPDELETAIVKDDNAKDDQPEDSDEPERVRDDSK